MTSGELNLLNQNNLLQNGYQFYHNIDSYDHLTRQGSLQNPVLLHHHDFYEVYLFLSGKVNYLVENRTYPLTPGDILLISPLELHQPHFEMSDENYDRIVLWVNEATLYRLSKPNISLLHCFPISGTPQSIQTQGNNLFHLNSTDLICLLDLFQQFDKELNISNHFSPLILEALLTEILCKINLFTNDKADNLCSIPRMSEQVADTVDYINEHLSEPLTLDLLSKKCFISKQHLLRCFKEAMGLSVHQYIQKKRLLLAHQLIQNSHSPKEAAILCGYSDYSVFYRAYKKEYQKSPSKI